MRVGIVGLGHLGKIHLKLINEISTFTLSALYDIDKEVMANLPYQNNAKLCTSYNELLELSDAVLIVTPTSSHFDLASSAIKKGKHVFIEKPATDNPDDTKTLINLAKEADVVVQVGHVERFNPAFTAAKQFISNPIHIDIQRFACYNKRGTDVSVVLDLMIHDIDLLFSMMPIKIRKISASGAAIVSKTADFATARIEFDNGCIANLTANRVALSNERKMTIFQKNTFINIDLLNKQTVIQHINPITNSANSKGIVIETGVTAQNFEITQNQLLIHPVNAIAEELNHFYKSIAENLPIAVTLNDAELALQAVHDIELQINSLIR